MRPPDLMSTLPDNEFDLEKLFLPAWAVEDSSSAKYAKYTGEEGTFDRRDDRRGFRSPRREGAGRRDHRPRGERQGPRGTHPRQDRGAAPERRSGEDRVRPRRPEDRPHREPPAPLPELEVSLVPDEKGVESLARQIKITGRAYPLFDIAQMILQKPERHSVVFSVRKSPEGQPVQPLLLCALDDTLWLSEEEAVAHVLKKHFDLFYQAERTPTEPPKGKYTFVAQCGISGQILGPPNHHDYQNQLRRLHAERFSRMPFEAYRARVRIVRDEEVVKKWVDDQSWKTEYICLNLPEPLKLPNMEAVEKHFKETHKENIIKPVENHTLGGPAARALRSSGLVRLSRSVWEDQRRFPLQIATSLSQQFSARGLQFFKVNKTVTHVCVARPHYLDLGAAPVSEGIKRIVEYLNGHPKSTRRSLVEALAPSPVALTAPPAASGGGQPGAAQPPVPSGQPEVTGEPTAALQGESAAASQPDAAAGGRPAAVAETIPAESVPPSAPAQNDQPTPEQTEVIADLHWLIHQGHVIEFANGVLETAKKPAPKPARPVKPTPPADQAQAPEATQPQQTQAAPESGTVPPAPEFPAQSEAPALAQANGLTSASAEAGSSGPAPAGPASEARASGQGDGQATTPSAMPIAREPANSADERQAQPAPTERPVPAQESPVSPTESPENLSPSAAEISAEPRADAVSAAT
jgi:hypothetical protein